MLTRLVRTVSGINVRTSQWHDPKLPDAWSSASLGVGSDAAMDRQPQQLFIAVVEDDTGLREATESLLSSAGFEVLGFSTAERFLKSRRGRKASCLILDVRLPGMSGLELQQRLLAKALAIPIVFISAEEDREGLARAQASGAGAVAFLSKPFADDELLHAIQCALKKHS